MSIVTERCFLTVELLMGISGFRGKEFYAAHEAGKTENERNDRN